MFIKEIPSSVPICCCMFIDSSIGKILIRVESDYVQTHEDQTTEQVLTEFDKADVNRVVCHETIPQLYRPTTMKNSSLNEYLNRPVLIANYDLNPGSSYNYSRNPWYDYFNHPSIKKKIDNYAFIRCDLHLKFVINATPFYYGALQISYMPLNAFDSAKVVTSGTLIELVSYSQRPHLDILISESQGGEMLLPYINHKEWLDITSTYALQSFGQLRIATYVPTTTVGAGTLSDIDLQIYAWAENVELAGATVKLAVQSDEYKRDGPISKPASAIARASGLLSKVPMIGSFATATQIGMDSVANIASLFGYTKIANVENTKPVKNMPFRAFANSDIGDVVDKLSVDCKNELTIDSACLGDPLRDYMLITNFVQHNSYLTKFTWTSAAAYNALLWNTYITPYMCVATADTQQTRIDATPMWLVANMFEFWRGDIIFDFKVVCSKYHRGRLRFSWDPVGDVANTSDCMTEVNNQIIDINESKEFSIRVPYMQQVAYCNIPTDPASTIFNTSPLAPDHSDTINGIMTVRVLTEQTSPSTSADITILVFVRGAENLEFSCPKEINNTISQFTVQSGDFVTDKVERIMGAPSSCDKNINLVYMGEKVASFRELLQRTNFSDSDSMVEEASATVVGYMYASRRPIYNGYDPNGIHTANGLVSAVSEPYNFVKPSPYTLLVPCFLGERGSITWHFNVSGFEETTVTISRSRELLTAAKYASAKSAATNGAQYASREQSLYYLTNAGTMMTNQFTNAGSSATLPMYSQLTMLDTNPDYRVLGKSGVSKEDSMIYAWINHEWKDRGTDHYLVEKYYNVGPDHSLIFFLNVPTMFVYSTFPVAV